MGATFLVRDMVNMPTECMGPAQIQRVGELLAAKFGAKASTIVGDDLLKVSKWSVWVGGTPAARVIAGCLFIHPSSSS